MVTHLLTYSVSDKVTYRAVWGQLKTGRRKTDIEDNNMQCLSAQVSQKFFVNYLNLTPYPKLPPSPLSSSPALQLGQLQLVVVLGWQGLADNKMIK